MSVDEALTSRNATTGEVIGSVPITAGGEVHGVVARAHAAFESEWPDDAKARSLVLLAWADTLASHSPELVELLVAETGKVKREAAAEVAASIDTVRYNAGLTRHLDGLAGTLSDGSAAFVERVPVGVAAFIVPWNAPMLLLVRDLAPALAVGVTAVVKPAPQTPLCTSRVIELAAESGLPEGVVLNVFGGAETGEALVEDPLVRTVAFTGSTAAGRRVIQAASKDFTRILMELGGKSASVLFEDCDREEAIDTCLRSAFAIAGQFCMANSRLLVARGMFDDVRSAVCEWVAALTVGPPQNEDSSLGPLISEAQLQRVMSTIEIARAAGVVAIGGTRASVDGCTGAFMTPTVLAGESMDARIVEQEIFGPVVTVEPFDTEDEAIRSANRSPYGLAASVWTRDVDRAWRVARKLEAGTVWVNRYNAVFSEVPMGGWKQSGYGRTRGVEGLRAFSEVKHINWRVRGS